MAWILLLFLLSHATAWRVCEDESHTRFWKNVTLKAAKTADAYNFRVTHVITHSGPLGVSAWMNSFHARKEVDDEEGTVEKGKAVITARLTASQQFGPIPGTPPSLHFATFGKKTDFIPYDNVTGDGNVTVGRFGFAFAIVFTEIAEFVDKNGDRKYDPGDQLLQTVKLDQFNWDNLCWAAPNAFTPGIISFNISGSQGQLTFSEKVEFSNVVGRLHNNKILTPRSGKISVQINNFPYTNGVTDSQLALHVYVVAAAGSRKAVAKRLGTSRAMGFDDDTAYLQWDGDVNVSRTSSAAIHGGDFEDGDAADIPGETTSIVFSAYQSGNLTVKQAWFSVDATQPDYVYWDPEVGAGPIPEESDGLPKWALILIVAGAGVVVVALVGIAFATWRRRRSSYVDL